MELFTNQLSDPKGAVYLRTRAQIISPQDLSDRYSLYNELVDAMFRRMDEDDGVGLAVNQIWTDELQNTFGVMPRVFVAGFESPHPRSFSWQVSFPRRAIFNPTLSFVNPHIRTLFPESCLSLREAGRLIFARPAIVVLEGLTLQGEVIRETYYAFRRLKKLAEAAKTDVVEYGPLYTRVLKHELDHLDGVVITDYYVQDKDVIPADKWKEERVKWKSLRAVRG